MVKLFVGNLSDSVDSHRLKNLFLQYVQVQECDVLKNFAFVHVGSDEDAELCIKNLHKTTLEGRELHLERSTSKLRKEPGMSDKCFTCGATDHKTPNCPQEQNRRKKRALDGLDDLPVGPDGKKPAILPTINLAGASGTSTLTQAPTTWGCKVGGGNDADPELPCPTNPELRTLYDQYLDARTKYFFYRERLSKELSMQPTIPMHLGRFDMTRSQPHQLMAQMASKPTMMMPQATPILASTQPTLQYSAPPASYQPVAAMPQSVYASAPVQSLQSTPVSAYMNRQPSYVTATSQQAQLIQPTAIASSLQAGAPQPTAPYNSMVRQAPLSSVNYATPQQQPYLVQQQNGQQSLSQPQSAPSAPYSSNPAYRTPAHMYATTNVHSYNSIPTGPR